LRIAGSVPVLEPRDNEIDGPVEELRTFKKALWD